jgi:hypothetical protein
MTAEEKPLDEDPGPVRPMGSADPLAGAYDPDLSIDLFKDWRQAGQTEAVPGQNAAYRKRNRKLLAHLPAALRYND